MNNTASYALRGTTRSARPPSSSTSIALRIHSLPRSRFAVEKSTKA